MPTPLPLRARPLAVLAAMLWPVAAHGQATGADGDIVVLGSPLPLPPGTPAYGAVVIGYDRLDDNASGRIEDVLGDVAGFQQFRRSDSRSANPSAQGATLRALGGNAASRTLVLLDGVPIADPFFGYLPFNAIAPERLAAARVTRGGGAGPFGSGAVAGTIELASATRRDLPLLSGEALYGSRDAQSLSAALSPDLGGGFVTLSGRFERGDGFWTTPPDQRVAASVPARYRDWSVSARAVAPLGAGMELQFRMLAFDDHRTLRFAGADSSSQGQDASVRLISRGRWQVDAIAYLQARNFTNRVISATSFRLTLDQRNTPATGMGGKIELRPPLGPDHLLRIGGDVRIGDGELYEDAYAASGTVTARRRAGGRSSVVGLFVEDDWTIGRLVLTGGARMDRWRLTRGFFEERNGAGATVSDLAYPDRAGTELTGRAGLIYRAATGVAIRAAGYTGFRLPTLNELYRPFTVFPVTTRANAALNPERLRGIEGGVELAPGGGLTLSGTIFYNRLDDAIANVTIGTNLRQRMNVRAIDARGAEAEVEWRAGAVSLNASYAYADSRVDAPGSAMDGLIPAQSPRHSASATLAWAPRRGPMLSATLRYVGDQFEDDLQTDRLPGAVTLAAFARVPIAHGAALVLRAENLLDARVVTRNQGGSIDLGTPRTLWVGLRFER